MRAAGAAVQMMQEQALRRKGDDAILFQPLPSNEEDLPSLPTGKRHVRIQAPDGDSEYELAWIKLGELMEELKEQMRSKLDVATNFRDFLLGPDPSPAEVERIDRLFRELGLLLPDSVT